MNHRQKLVELRDLYMRRGCDEYILDAAGPEACLAFRSVADDIDAILADWPEDAKAMPREPQQQQLDAAYEAFVEAGGSIDSCLRKMLVASFDTYNPEDER